MSAFHPPDLPDPPRGYRYYHSAKEILHAPELYAYQHMLLRAWDAKEGMHLSGVLTLNGVPTVYIRDFSKPATEAEIARLQQQFWNQGIATLLLVRDPFHVRVFSSMVTPVAAETATREEIDALLVEKLDLAAQAQWAEKFYIQLDNGHYYNADARVDKFRPQHGVDAYLLNNLAAVRDKLVTMGLTAQTAHAFLGRLLFTCYLCDRGIVELSNYFKGKPGHSIRELLTGEDPAPALYGKLYPALKTVFNSSMFDADLVAERQAVESHPGCFEIVLSFLRGDDLTKGNQPTLGFWAYDFRLIPVETVSAIYENFLEGEDSQEKQKAGAFYTPRFLAEIALDIALKKVAPLFEEGRRYLDPSCGSGIFLVLLFNRLAAEWTAGQKRKPTPQEKADALLERLNALRGVDKNLTACRIACFSLYLAFLDQFDPPDIENYKLEFNKKKLPNLLHAKAVDKVPEYPVIREADFFDYAPDHAGQFDVIIGNPPWAGRSSNQVAHEFMEKTPALLKPEGSACLLLPSKVFLNRTDKFQKNWLKSVTLDKVIQLADYRHILFKKAICPCSMALFRPSTPAEDHEIEYIAPKVSRSDLRDGLILVKPADRQWISQRRLLGAAEQGAISMAWKGYLWGTARDHKFLDYLFSFPRLSDLTDLLSDLRKSKKKRSKPWAAGQGFKPYSQKGKNPDRDLKPLGPWEGSDHFIEDSIFSMMPHVPEVLCGTLEAALKEGENLPDYLYSKPEDDLFRPPLVLFNQGFTNATFVDYTVRFQDALQSIAGPEKDAAALMFLAAFLRSPLARYFIFHTAANVATERPKVHLVEALRLPFFLPGSEFATPDAEKILKKAVAQIQRHQKEMQASADKLLAGQPVSDVDKKELDDWFIAQRIKAAKLQGELNPLIYAYYGLNEQEQALVEDTCQILDISATPRTLEAARSIPTLQPVTKADELEPYAAMLAGTLNDWATGSVRAAVTGGVDPEVGMALIEVTQVKQPVPFQPRAVQKKLGQALASLHRSSTQEDGAFLFERTGLIFDGTRISIVKPAQQGQWTRTAAMNDAGHIYAEIAKARQQAATPKT
ncbi:type I restriction-modification system DNA methylase subunit [Prosthecobacter fusiformis]|uniref:site-specific DNA-methyltransferase (adenine-specific) n=1 Tax=Prosthecobacter fusiformis TaxID=48464 RepID=A0A4R7RLF9_9BACT|nr:N-6 DNA methylase [Prosthecobacter fusiformis]TDU62538.1 type I restriction-modification system DNA methylase subunit [Prosthecobacter fusiformis]